MFMKCIKMSIPFERMCRACMMTEAAAALMPIWPSPNDANDIITSNETVSSVATMFTSFTVFGVSGMHASISRNQFQFDSILNFRRQLRAMAYRRIFV